MSRKAKAREGREAGGNHCYVPAYLKNLKGVIEKQMAKITFEVEDTAENRRQLGLLLELGESTLGRALHSKSGKLILDFISPHDGEAMFVLTKAVSGHGFSLDIPEEVVPNIRVTVDGHKPATKGATTSGKRN